MPRILVATLILISSFFPSHLWAAPAQPTLIIGSIDSCPHQCNPQKEGGRLGYMTEIMKVIFEEAGYNVRIRIAPFQRSLKNVEQGIFDAMPSVNSYSSELILRSTQPSGIFKQHFYVKKNNSWRYQGPSSLIHITIGSVTGYDYTQMSPEYQAHLETFRYTQYVQFVSGNNAPLANLKKIIRGRITTFNEDADLVNYLAKQAGISDQIQEAGILGENPQYAGFAPTNPDSPNLIQIYDNGIQSLRESGRLQVILDKYGITDWAPLIRHKTALISTHLPNTSHATG